mmetsp:Transcript_14117/g.27872  ORF Transcript_14117/g.27872 Transcript_14117/m.27872 type:complete len:258 (-) Transcript_14117:1073-1846(-)
MPVNTPASVVLTNHALGINQQAHRNPSPTACTNLMQFQPGVAPKEVNDWSHSVLASMLLAPFFLIFFTTIEANRRSLNHAIFRQIFKFQCPLTIQHTLAISTLQPAAPSSTRMQNIHSPLHTLSFRGAVAVPPSLTLVIFPTHKPHTRKRKLARIQRCVLFAPSSRQRLPSKAQLRQGKGDTHSRAVSVAMQLGGKPITTKGLLDQSLELLPCHLLITHRTELILGARVGGRREPPTLICHKLLLNLLLLLLHLLLM